MRVKSLQLYPTLCDPMDCSPPGSSVREILQARILEWVAMPSSRGSFWPRDWTRVSCLIMSLALASRFFTTTATWEAQIHLLGGTIQLTTLVSILNQFSSSSLLLLFYIRNAGGCLGLFPLCLFIGQSSYTSVSFVGSGQLCNLIFRL